MLTVCIIQKLKSNRFSYYLVSTPDFVDMGVSGVLGCLDEGHRGVVRRAMEPLGGGGGGEGVEEEEKEEEEDDGEEGEYSSSLEYSSYVKLKQYFEEKLIKKAFENNLIK